MAETVPAAQRHGSGGEVGDTVVMGGSTGEAVELTTVNPIHYQQHEEIARGGMGVVRRARDQRIGREVALKELLDDAPHIRRRFEREARVTGQLQHPGIVPVYEVGRWPDGRPFYAMKLVNGRPLDVVVDEALDDNARLALITRVLPAIEAMAYAHDQGVIHRDLKPANILLSEFGETVVIDWGLAKAIDESDDELPSPGHDAAEEADAPRSGSLAAARTGGKLTLDGAVIGTPAYMPPEQACGDPVDARADVYSLGALVYHALTGRAPYRGKTAHDVLAAVLEGPPPSVGALAPSLPPDLVAIVDKAMAQDPLDRHANAGELARDLQAFSTGRLVGSYHYTSRDLLIRFVRRNRALSAALLGLAAMVVVGSAMVLAAYQSSEKQRARAEEAEERARREERAAHGQLAQMHANNAIQRLRDHDHLGAELFAAAALLEQPANEAGPHHALFEGTGAAPPPQDLIAAPGATLAAARALRFAARGRELPPHEEWVYDVLTSADDRWVVTTSADRRARVWDASTGEHHATLEGHEGTIYQAALNSTGRQLATSSYDGTVRLWSFPDGKLERTLEHPTDRVYGVCYTSDGSLLAAGAGGLLAFFDPTSGALDHQMDTSLALPLRLDCALDAPLALLGSKDTEALIVDVTARKVRHHLGQATTTTYGALTPDERYAIIADRTGRLRRFDAQTGLLLDEVATNLSCHALAMSSDGRWVALGGEAITVVDSTSLQIVARLRDHRARVSALAFDAADRHLFSGGFDYRVVEWTLPERRSAERFTSVSESRIDAVQLSADGASVIASRDDGTIVWWDRERGEVTHDIHTHAAPIRALRIIDDERLATSGMDRKLKVIDRLTRQVQRTIDLPHFGDELSLHPDGRSLALGSGDGSVLLFDTTTWSSRTAKGVHEDRTWWVGHAPNGQRLGTASFAGTVAILAPDTGDVLLQWRGHDARIYGATWHPDGDELVTIDFDGWVRAWDPTTGNANRQWRVLDGERLNRVAYSPNAKRILVTSHQGLRIYTPRGELTARLDLGPTTAADWTDDGRVVVAVGREVLILPLDASLWQDDPRRLVAQAEEAAATTLSGMMGMATGEL